MKKKYPILLLLLVLLGCSENKSVSTMAPTHSKNWMNPASDNFHGKVVLSRATSENCKKCHGEDMEGGKAEISCIDCHLEQGVCISCHGGIDNLTGAPPNGLRGETSPTTRAVGAHSAHLNAENSRDVACEDCHHVPMFLLDTMHIDIANLDSIAEINFSNIAENTIWHRTSDSCSNSYCHGNFEGGNIDNHPIWTDTLGADCGTCHPVAHNMSDFHVKHLDYIGIAGLVCGNCHAAVMDTLNNFLDKSLHVNGVVDTLILDQSLCYDCHASGPDSCYRCHGGLDNTTGAPPTGLDDETLITDLAVGAHTAHVEGNRFSNPYDCDICHIKPEIILDTIHFDGDNIAEVTFNTLAGVSSNWNRAAERCENIYCHGNFDGGLNFDPVWTAQNQAECGSCHELDNNPSSLGWKHEYHIAVAAIKCSQCHSQVVDDTLGIIDLDLHINGVADTSISDQALCDNCHGSGVTTCVGCHGGLDNLTGAPPYGLEYETAATSIAVGAHTSHATGNVMSDGVACESCHTIPAVVLAIGHLDGDLIPEINFGGIAGASSSWSRSTAQCSDTYCHGSFPNGNSANTPVWNSPNQSNCGSCHTVNGNYDTMSGRHKTHLEENVDCYECHFSVVDSNRNIIGYDLHVDGTIDISFSRGQGNYDGALCTTVGCHGTEYWINVKK